MCNKGLSFLDPGNMLAEGKKSTHFYIRVEIFAGYKELHDFQMIVRDSPVNGEASIVVAFGS